MERKMSCFEWSNYSSDYLDGTLTDALKREADDHLESCKECSERNKHYRLILSSIADQPRVALPTALKRSPFSAVILKGEVARFSLSRWEKIPWHIRTLVEGMGIVLVVLIGISSAPRLRALYEKSLERSLNDFKESLSLSENSEDILDPAIPPLQGKGGHAVVPVTSEPDELYGEDDSENDDVKVGKSELWRFTLKTVSPDEMRPQVVKALTELGIPMNTPGMGGTQVPGGIEFDMVLPLSQVQNIKHAIQKLAPKTSEESSDQPGSENFTWYKVKSRRKLPEGKSQVVIWLAQPN